MSFYEPYRVDEIIKEVRERRNVKCGPATFMSPIDDQARPKPMQNTSLYIELEKEVSSLIEEFGDWVWLQDEITGEKLKASEAFQASKR